MLDWVVKTVGMPLYDEAGNETSLFASMRQMSGPGIEAFNAKYPDGPGVFYASLTGRTDGHEGGDDCAPDVSLPFVSALELDGDPVDPLFSLPELLLSHYDGGGVNDALVRAKDARWGEFWGCVPADHLDQIGQLFGDAPGGSNPFRYRDLYGALVDHLRALGY